MNKLTVAKTFRVSIGASSIIKCRAILKCRTISDRESQERRATKRNTQSSHAVETMSAEAREMVDRAIEITCTERRRDPKGSVPIDDMQGRPSLSVQSAEAIAGSERAQRLLPVAKDLTIESLAGSPESTNSHREIRCPDFSGQHSAFASYEESSRTWIRGTMPQC